MAETSKKTKTGTSSQGRKQRLALSKAKLHVRQNLMHSPLSKTLRSKYGRRAIQLRKGDTVRVMRGQFRKHEGKVERIDLKRGKAYVAGVELRKQDASMTPYPVNPSNLRIELVDLSDAKRKLVLARTGTNAASEKLTKK
ncbi:50S ribosomal protein L24 [archaeon]|nr:50S ribosomal protein L24 [archaeon]|tara:strand:- start:359 stop:778 length:420 start_codon:yes stop_codon:yes gene_type:complete